ncbi:M56 family metallopeptidase [Stenotrophomonas sp.]|uniref:M56 family metallopeptidase n=1 Tax=Stenotrophomonas sp. TaxID=69392 RepID=UPI00289E50FA|nr:M56 family metallopeptidase [Stenotrophomonas sp.]
MSEMLVRLAWTSLQSAALVALVWAVCRWLPRLPAATRCRLWWLVAVQAVLGLVWSSPLELAVLPAPHVDTAAMAMQPMLQQATALAPVVAETALPSSFALVPASAAPTWPLLVFALWASGVLLMLVRSVHAYRQSRALVRNAAPCTDAGLQQALQLAAEAHGLARAPQLKISAQIRSPQLIGPWNPVLLLPARELPAMAADDLDMALTHELVHLQRRDLWWGLLPALAQHLLFFHPLVHLAAREYSLAREEACDSAVVAGHGHCRHDYGRLLVQLGVAPRPAVGVASASPNFRSLKRRLLTLQQTGTLPRVVSISVTALFVLVGVAPLRLVAAVPPPPPAPPAPPALAAPAVPAAPAAPAAPAVPAPEPAPKPAAAPRPPAAPAAPAAPPAPAADTRPVTRTHMVTTGRLDLSHQPPQAFVLLDRENSFFVDGSMADIEQAKRDARGSNRVLWARRGDQRYLINDPALMKSLTLAQQEVAKLGHEQGLLGTRQGELGKRMGEISLQASRQAMASLDAAEMANQAARQASAQAEAELATVSAKQQQALARQQQGLAREQQALAQQQSQVSAKMARDIRSAIDQALANGTAQSLR